MKKRLTCLLLAAVLVLGLLPTALAENSGTNEPQELQTTQDFTYNGQTYTLAMGHLENSGAVKVFTQGRIGASFISGEKPGTMLQFYDVVVGIFQNIDDKNLSECKNLIHLITNVTFSVAGDCAAVGETVGPNSEGTEERDSYWYAPLSYKVSNGEGILQAIVTLRIDGKEQVHTLQIGCHTTIVENTSIDCADPDTFPGTYTGTDAIDTMEELNALIAGLELSKDPNARTEVRLAPVVYEGVLELGNTTGNRNLSIVGTETRKNGMGCATAIIGGIEITAHGGTLSNLYLKESGNTAYQVKDSQDRSCGILTAGGEYSVITNCVFEGYDIGLANQDGYIAPRSFNRFRDCGIGVQITANAYGNGNSIVEQNKFTNCGTGLLIEALPEYISNYGFRVFNCDFLDNDTDITSGKKDGYYYCYGNFYGKTNGNGDIIFRNAKGSTARVLTNPRMKSPVCMTAGPDQWTLAALTDSTEPVAMFRMMRGVSLLSDAGTDTAVNYVTVEESEETTVTRDEIYLRNDLTMDYTITDPDFYSRTKPLTIHVLDNNENPIGNWRFAFPLPENDAPATSPNFNAFLEVSQQANAMTVTVSNNGNECLPVLTPTLTIPCDSTWTAVAVTKDGTSVDASVQNGSVSFPVNAGGTYTITATAVQEQLMVSQVAMAPDGSFDVNDSLFSDAKLTVPYGTYFTVATVGLQTNWLGENAAVTSSDTSIFTVEREAVSNGRAVYFLKAEGVGAANLQYTNGTETLTLPVTVNAPGAAGIPGGITVGFGSYMNPDETMLFLMTGDPKNSNDYGSSYHPYDAAEGYQPYRDIMIRAGIYSDTDHLYQEQTDVKIEVQKLWIERLTGDADVFSWSQTEHQKELTINGAMDRVQLYAKNKEGTARLWAEITINGNEWTTTISARARMTALTVVEDDTIDTLSEVKGYLENTTLQNGTIYRFTLKPGKHTGTLTLPENIMGKMIYISGAENGSTTIEGGIDLNGSGLTEISNICFTSPEGEDTKAIYNGNCMSVANCSFYNYDVALDGTEAGLVNPGTGNLFVNNDVAVSVDVEDVSQIAHVLCDRNTFINNETAVKVISLHKAVGPFRFRITNSNFINNGTDFDLDYAGSYYFYKNYFGDYVGSDKPTPGKTGEGKNNGKDNLNLAKVLQSRSENSLRKVLESRTARVEKADGVTATTNPRWAYPVIKWWYKNVLDEDAVYGNNAIVIDEVAAVALLEETDTEPEPEYVNYLTSDWDGTEIVNAESGELLLDAKAFDAQSEKVIDVVSVTDTDAGTTTEVLGSWTFD